MKPILFSGPMVQAILAGKKTQTRRLVKPQPEPMPDDVQRVQGDNGFWIRSPKAQSMVSVHFWKSLCPYGQTGEVLWVRETWWQGGKWNYTEDQTGEREHYWDSNGKVVFNPPEESAKGQWRKKPSIHMPRSACRLFLQITNVRVERLQEISESDARAEGVTLRGDPQATTVYDGIYREHFHRLWDSLNEDRAPWSENPWVWVVEFKRIEQGEIAA